MASGCQGSNTEKHIEKTNKQGTTNWLDYDLQSHYGILYIHEVIKRWHLFCWTFAKASFKQNWKNEQMGGGMLKKNTQLVACYHSTYDMIMVTTFLKKYWRQRKCNW